jgi:hypothetical protein
MTRFAPLYAALLLSGCANGALQRAEVAASAPAAEAATDYSCRADVARLQEKLANEVAERQRVTRVSQRREEALRKQLDAMKSIERGILERDDRLRTETR